MHKKKSDLSSRSYEERLFGGGVRKYLHEARFRWIRRALLSCRADYESVLELGCFNGRVIDFLPQAPVRYLGLDANEEGQLEKARHDWQHRSEYEFRTCQIPEQMKLGGEKFDVFICMETIEHISDDMIDDYLELCRQHTGKLALFTIPNEKGIVFLAKHLAHLLRGEAGSYTLKEVLNTVFHRIHLVKRTKYHKGFDYSRALERIGRYFNVIKVKGEPIRFLPPILNFTVCIVATPK